MRARARVFAFACEPFPWRASAHAEIRAEWMEVAALIVRSAQVSSFNICCTRVKKGKEKKIVARRGLLRLSRRPAREGEEPAPSGTSD